MQQPRLSTDLLWLQTALLLLAMIPVSLFALYLEERTFNGINVWIKPIKFQLSGAVHLITLYIVAQLMTIDARRAIVFRGLVWVSAIATLYEILYISFRASQASASHFNFTSPIGEILYLLMGLGAILMILPAIYLGVRFIVRTNGFLGSKNIHLGIVSGFIVGSILTLAFGAYMSANGSHWTSGQDSDFGGLFLFGWSQVGGDLRPAHFFALHLLQVVPIMAFLTDRFMPGAFALQRIAVVASLMVMTGLSVFTFKQALNGEPFLVVNPPTGLEYAKPINSDEMAFWNTLQAQCGKRFVGKMTYPSDAMDSFAGKELVATFLDCNDSRIAVPFRVGEDTSRTWVFTKTPAGIRLKHDHRHNGKPDPTSNYGGMSADGGSALQQAFPADAYTAQIIPAASTNVWNILISDDGNQLTYHLERHAKPRFTAELLLVE